MTPQLVLEAEKMKNELRALKVAHPRGLGMADFFLETVVKNLTPYAQTVITATFDAGSVFPPYVDLSISPYESGGAYLYDETFDELTHKYSIKFSPNNGGTYTFKLVSSTEITGMTVVQ